MPYCRQCATQLQDTAAFCPSCGAQQLTMAGGFANTSSPVVAPVNASPRAKDDEENLIRRIADYERISGYIWIVIGIMQILSLFGIIAGIWNIFAGRSSLKLVPHIRARSSRVPSAFENIGGLVVIGLVNFFLGGVIGVVFVAFDFYIRDLVLTNRRLFCRAPLPR